MTADVWQTVFFLMNSILELSKKSNMGFNLQRRGAKMLVKTQFATSIKVVRSDNGQEFLNHEIYLFCKTHGVIHQHSCVDTPQKNVVVERKHRQLLNIARALRFQSNLPLEFWGECILNSFD